MTKKERIEAAQKRIAELKNLLMNGLKDEIHT